MTDVEALMALLARLDQDQLAQLPPERLEVLSDALYRGHAQCELAVDQQPFPRVRPRQEPKSGVLKCLKDGERTP